MLHDHDTEKGTRLAQVLDDYLAACASGGRPDVEALAHEHPDLAEDLRTCLASLRLIGAAAAGAQQAAESADAEGPPSEPAPPLGDFELLREIGRGGMGVVYEARQISLARRVALKVLPFAGVLDPRQLQRFKNEALAAAQLDHPHIVDVIGVGCERGVNYYAMRFVDGPTLAQVIEGHRLQVTGDREQSAGRRGGEGGRGDAENEADGFSPLSHPRVSPPSPPLFPTRACDLSPLTTHHPPTTPTLPIAGLSTSGGAGSLAAGGATGRAFYRAVAELGIAAAEALHHAHEHGIVHRDVKPGNLMVDQRGKLWVADFGLAQIESAASLTTPGDLLGTLRYMSPEQALAKRVAIDYRTDIYSLGATLYELATLEPVFDARDKQELLRQLSFEEPRPLRKVRRGVPAEIETIVLKALEKNPADRYQAAQELADDLRRYLADEPIHARRPGIRSRAVKWGRRHPAALTALAAVALLAALAGPLVAWRESSLRGLAETRRQAATASATAEKQARLAALEAAQAEKQALQKEAAERQQREAVARYFVQAFTRTSPLADGRELKVVDVLDEAVAELADQHDLAPTIQADILDAFGRAYFGLGLPDKAVTVHERLLALRREALDPEDPAILAGVHNLALAYCDAGRFGEAIPLFEEALGRATEKMGRDAPEVLIGLTNLGRAYRGAGRFNEAIPILREALAKLRKKMGTDDASLLISTYELAAAYRDAGRWDELPPLAESLTNAAQELGPGHPITSLALELVAVTYHHAGRTHEASLLLEQALANARNTLGPDHINTLAAMNNLGSGYTKEGRVADAIELLEEARAKTTQTLGRSHPLALTAASNLGDAYNAARRFKEAIPLLEDALAKRNEGHEEGHPSTLSLVNHLADSYRGVGRLNDAIPLYDEVLQKRSAKLGPAHPDTLSVANDLAVAYLDAGRIEQALPLFKSVLTGKAQQLGPDHADTLRLMNNMAVAYMEAGRLDEAVPLLAQALGRQNETLGPDHLDTLQTKHSLASAYLKLGKANEALPLAEQALAGREKLLAATHPETLKSMNNLAVAYVDIGRRDDAIALLERMLMANKKSLGAQDPSILPIVNNLALAYRDAGQLDRALPLAEEALEISTTALGRNHPRTLQMINNLAITYWSAGKLDESVPLLEQALKGLQASLGADHPETLNTAANLAANYRDVGRLREAIALFEETLAGAHRNPGSTTKLLSWMCTGSA